MKLNELSNEQRLELKENYLCHHDDEDHSVSWGELTAADTLVSDEDLEREFGVVEFTNDDFSCSIGKD